MTFRFFMIFGFGLFSSLLSLSTTDRKEIIIRRAIESYDL
jgi:hypothetical protein